MCKTERHIITDSEKVEFFNLIEGKGQKTPKDWQLIHSEICKPDEDDKDLDSIIDTLSEDGVKFAIDVVSNPNEPSFLDSGIVKVRYRYVLDPIHAGEEKIKDNTRDFCAELIRRDLIYRREDINQMSFRGANPIANQRYSIFNSAGGWNCRHAWQREIYVLPQRVKTVKNGLKTSTEDVPKIQMQMAKEEKSLKVKFGEWLKEQGAKLTQEEVVEMTSVMLENEGEEQKFVDVQVDDKILRINAEVPEEGAAVSWVDAEGNMMDVEDGEYPIEFDGKNWIVTIEDRVIKSIKDIAEAESSEEAEQEMSSEENTEEQGPSLSEQFTELKESIPGMIAEAIQANLSAHSDKQQKVFSTIVDAKLKGLPAFPQDEVDANLSSNEGEAAKEGTLLERVVGAKIE